MPRYTYNIQGKSNIGPVLLRGGYPEPCANKKVDINLWCSSYVSTYLERDIRNLSQVGDLGEFERRRPEGLFPADP